VAARKAWVGAGALMLASAIAIAAAPAQPAPDAPRKPVRMEPETNEQVVADFLTRKARAEKAQGAIVLGLKKSLDQKRDEFERARKKFDDARGVYADIVGPLARQGVMHPDDPRLPYDYELRRAAPDSTRGGDVYRRVSPAPGAPIHP